MQCWANQSELVPCQNIVQLSIRASALWRVFYSGLLYIFPNLVRKTSTEWCCHNRAHQFPSRIDWGNCSQIDQSIPSGQRVLRFLFRASQANFFDRIQQAFIYVLATDGSRLASTMQALVLHYNYQIRFSCTIGPLDPVNTDLWFAGCFSTHVIRCDEAARSRKLRNFSSTKTTVLRPTLDLCLNAILSYRSP